MARPPLRCWWDDIHVADFIARKPWQLDCRYTDEALERWPTNTPLLSCSLPVQRRPLRAAAFLQGVLPEGRHLQALARLANVTTNDIRGLLARYGRDIAGALVIGVGDEPPERDHWAVEPYTADSLAAEVLGLDNDALGVRADSELSIAGLQDKLLLVDLGTGRWGRPTHGHPSTHILKVDSPRYPGLIAAEGHCLRLAERVGLGNLAPLTTRIGDQTCLIVKRYDRATKGTTVGRIHQEDSCQALGIDPQGNRGRAKYEAAGGPTLAQIAALLALYAADVDRELGALVRAVTFTIVIGNADAHGKNVSFLPDLDGHVALAPLYDTVPTILWPSLRSTAAMSVNGKIDFGRVGLHDIASEASRWGLDFDRALTIAHELAGKASAALSDIVTDDRLSTRIAERIDRLLAQA